MHLNQVDVVTEAAMQVDQVMQMWVGFLNHLVANELLSDTHQQCEGTALAAHKDACGQTPYRQDDDSGCIDFCHELTAQPLQLR